MSKPKLIYFPLAARGEPTRLAFLVGGIDFEDSLVNHQTWKDSDLKQSTPFGQLPVLEHNGKVIAQSGATLRYAARLGGLYPEDPWEAALADQAWFQYNDIADVLRPTMYLATPAEKIAARQELLQGKLKEKLTQLEALLAGKDYFTGSKLSYADLEIYSWLSIFKSGTLDGVPTNVLDSYPALKAFRNRVASLPKIAAKYANETEGARAHFKPDTA